MRWVNRRPRRGNRMLLGAIPIILLIVLYLAVAGARHAVNPADKILPLPGAMIEAMASLVTEPDQLSGEYLFWADTLGIAEILKKHIK